MIAPKCGACKDARIYAEAQEAAAPQRLTLVGGMKRCIVHDQSYTRVCTGCAADRLAGEAS